MTQVLPPLHPSAIGFSAIRGLPDGSMRQYSAVEFDLGWDGAAAFYHRLKGLRFVRASTTDASGYAVLDVNDAAGDIVQDFDIPTAQAFQYIKRMLKLTVVA